MATAKKAITFYASPAVVDWYESLPDGDGSRTINQYLIESIERHKPADPVEVEDDMGDLLSTRQTRDAWVRATAEPLLLSLLALSSDKNLQENTRAEISKAWDLLTVNISKFNKKETLNALRAERDRRSHAK